MEAHVFSIAITLIYFYHNYQVLQHEMEADTGFTDEVLCIKVL